MGSISFAVGIDPGTKQLGYAVWEVGGEKPRVVASGILKRKSSDKRRFSTMVAALKAVVKPYLGRATFFIEELFFDKSSMMVLFEMVGAIKCFAEDNFSSWEDVPIGWKLRLTGCGNCSHDAYRLKAAELLGRPIPKSAEDEAAAIGIGLFGAAALLK
jgi:Holliday junction resolvasome RuvABC endonuclease subunit